MTIQKSLSNRAIVVVVQRNSEIYLKRCLSSVLTQNFKDVGIIFIDDCSNDNSYAMAEECLSICRDVVLRRNVKKQSKLKSWIEAVRDCCSNTESVIFWLDGDDWIRNDYAIRHMMRCHKMHDVVWSQHVAGSKMGCSDKLTQLSVRKNKWVSSHLKSFKKHLFDRIDDDDFRNSNGEYFESAVDQAIMIPILEMAGPKRRHFHDEILYQYNITGNCMHQNNLSLQIANEREIRKKNSYDVCRKVFSFGDVYQGDGRQEIIDSLLKQYERSRLIVVGKVNDNTYFNKLRDNKKIAIRVVENIDEILLELTSADIVVQMQSFSKEGFLFDAGTPLIARSGTNVAKKIITGEKGVVFDDRSFHRKIMDALK